MEYFDQHVPRDNSTAVVIFEDDAHCQANTTAKISSILQAVPSDWDMIFIGGKPIGMVGKEDGSPLSPSDTIDIRVEDPWWRVKHITNTHSYIIKRSSLRKIIELLMKKLKNGFKAGIDILYDWLFDDKLVVYMPPRPFCEQKGDPRQFRWFGFNASQIPWKWQKFPDST